jgi:hypothetical protein
MHAYLVLLACAAMLTLQSMTCCSSSMLATGSMYEHLQIE